MKHTGVLFLRLISYLVLYRTCNISGFLYTSFTRSSEMNLCPALSVKCILSNLTSEIQIDRSICQILHIICLCLPKFESLFALISFSIILSFSSEISGNGFHWIKTFQQETLVETDQFGIVPESVLDTPFWKPSWVITYLNCRLDSENFVCKANIYSSRVFKKKVHSKRAE